MVAVHTIPNQLDINKIKNCILASMNVGCSSSHNMGPLNTALFSRLKKNSFFFGCVSIELLICLWQCHLIGKMTFIGHLFPVWRIFCYYLLLVAVAATATSFHFSSIEAIVNSKMVFQVATQSIV